jgi:hypothetical protein
LKSISSFLSGLETPVPKDALAEEIPLSALSLRTTVEDVCSFVSHACPPSSVIPIIQNSLPKEVIVK